MKVFCITLTALTLIGCANYSRIRTKHVKVKETALQEQFADSSFVLSRADSNYYEDAYRFISSMLDSQIQLNFRDAVFTVENAYHNDSLDYGDFLFEIGRSALYTDIFTLMNEKSFEYDFEDRFTVLTHAGLFHIMTDTFQVGKSVHLPIRYNFADHRGKVDWKSTFVSTALKTRKGNCQSMAYLYKIIADELGVETHLAFAPNHIYIKHRCEGIGMYNTELTTATFPVDGWIMASGYIHLDAVRSGIYMNPLSDREAVAITLIDLARGYKRKCPGSVLPLTCCERVLKDYPDNIYALLLKAELTQGTSAHEALIRKIYKLGYRQMPDRMYLNWLDDLRQNIEKNSDKKINFRNN